MAASLFIWMAAAAAAAAAAGARGERLLPPLPGCPPADVSDQLRHTTLSRLVKHACVPPVKPGAGRWSHPLLSATYQLDEVQEVDGEGRPALFQLEDGDDLRSQRGADDWRRVPFDWSGWVAPTQAAVPGELCRNHSRAYARALLRAAPWALRMADASGKLPDGLLYGNGNLLGSWDGCRAVRVELNASDPLAPAERTFAGQLCSAVIMEAANGSSATLGLVPALPPLARAGLAVSVRFGYCVPSSCDAEDVRVSLALALNDSGLVAVVSDCHADGERAQLDAADWAMVAFLALTAAALLGCTVADLVVTRCQSPPTSAPPSWPTVLVRAFSLHRSVPRLLSTRTDPQTIGCLHGMRCLTMAWIVLGHIYVIGLYLLPINNMGSLPDLLQPLPFQVVMNAPPAVDTFLVISGAMFSYSLFRAERAGRRVGPRQVLALYVHRYLRLTPLYAAVIWFTATLLRHIGSGMFTAVNFASFGITGCRQSWWHNLLYINNFYPNDETVCIDQAWYLALDMQLFAVAPVLVLPVLRWPRAGAAWLAVFAAAAIVTPGVITYLLDLPPTLLNLNMHATEPRVMADFTRLVYNAPWSRAAPYIVGLALGLLLGRARAGPQLPPLSRPVCALLWLLSTTVALLVLFGMWAYNRDPAALWSPAVAVAYAALHRPAWALCCAWVIFACATGRGGPVDALLSHAVWRPLSRLTYATYLTSIQLMVWFASQARAAVAADHLWFVYWFLADLLVNVAVATVFSLAFEWPAAALEKAVRERAAPAAPKRGEVRILSVSKRDFQ